jgi:hypothetical protein
MGEVAALTVPPRPVASPDHIPLVLLSLRQIKDKISRI